MASESEVTELHQEIDKTRADLAGKLETLEDQVMGTIRSTTENVEETIENVTSTVQETVTQVKRTFDLEYQMRQRPWVLVGGSVLAGFLVGSYFGRQAQPRPWGSRSGGAAAAYATRGAEPARPGYLDWFFDQFQDEIGKVKEIAVGYVGGLARDLVKEAVPDALGPRVQEIADSATTKLGGQPMDSSVFAPETSG